MPTGYTDKIKNGITFEEFAINCARAFGATITMRGASLDKPIPDKFASSRYHIDKLAKAKRRLTKLGNTTTEEADKLALADYEKEKKHVARVIADSRRLMKQYKNMLNQVEVWVPPTTGHTELKNFMIKQIKDSMNFDNMEGHHTDHPAIQQTGAEWLQTNKRSCQYSIAYHTEERKKEAEITRNNTVWVNDLRNSLLCDKFGTDICDKCAKRFICFTIINYKRVENGIHD